MRAYNNRKIKSKGEENYVKRRTENFITGVTEGSV